MSKKQKAAAQVEFHPEDYRGFEIPLWNPEQEMASRTIRRNDITILTGPAGTSKTFVSVAYAVTAVLRGEASKIVVGRPAMQAYEDLGALPGTEEEKIAPYLEPIFEGIDRATGGNSDLRRFIRSKTKATGLAYLRGRTFWDSVVVIDEAQNLQLGQLMMIISRLAKGSKLVFAGDTSQSDIPRGGSCLRDAAVAMQGIRRFGWYEFTPAANVRHPIIAEAMDRLVKLRDQR